MKRQKPYPIKSCLFLILQVNEPLCRSMARFGWYYSASDANSALWWVLLWRIVSPLPSWWAPQSAGWHGGIPRFRSKMGSNLAHDFSDSSLRSSQYCVLSNAAERQYKKGTYCISPFCNMIKDWFLPSTYNRAELIPQYSDLCRLSTKIFPQASLALVHHIITDLNNSNSSACSDATGWSALSLSRPTI